MSLKFIETDQGWISDRFIVRMVRDRPSGDFRVTFLDGSQTATATAREEAVSEYLHKSGQDRVA